MGEPLLQSSPAFRRAVHACAAALKPHGLDLLAEFGKEEGLEAPLPRHGWPGGCAGAHSDAEIA